MIVILEGPDGAGKTHLAQELIRQNPGLVYHHEGPPPMLTGTDGLMRYYGAQLDAARGHAVVFDRFALGELVYGPLLRGKSALSLAALRELRRLMAAVGAWQVLCLPDYQVCFNSWNTRPHEFINSGTIFQRSYDAWHTIGASGAFDHVYDYTREDAFELFQTVAEKETPTRYERAAYTLPAGWTGSPAARFVFVADRPSDPVNVPFFSTTGCAPYLRRALDMAGLEDHETAFVNAYTYRGQPVALDRRFFTGRVVAALGRNAHRALQHHGVSHHELPHPAYRRRFHHNGIHEYAAMFAGLKRLT